MIVIEILLVLIFSVLCYISHQLANGFNTVTNNQVGLARWMAEESGKSL